MKAFGGRYLSDKVADTTVTLLKFRNKVKSHIFVSCLHPYKDQRLVVVGEKGMLVFADVLSDQSKLVFYKISKVGWVKNIPLVQKAEGKKIPFNYNAEPLKLECKAFVDWVIKKRKHHHLNGGRRLESFEGIRVS